MDVSSIVYSAASDRLSKRLESQEKAIDKQNEKKKEEEMRRKEEELLNPVDRAQIQDQSHSLGLSIAYSIIGSTIG